MLALFAALGLPLSLASRSSPPRCATPSRPLLVMLGCFVAGYLGLLLSPAVGHLDLGGAGRPGPGNVPAVAAADQPPHPDPKGAGALSGFSQGMGYTLPARARCSLGLLHQWTGSWTVPFMFLFATLLLLGAGAWIICRPKMLEDDFAPAVRRISVLQDVWHSRCPSMPHDFRYWLRWLRIGGGNGWNRTLRGVTPEELSAAIATCLKDAVDAGELTVPAEALPTEVKVDRPKSREHGDWATNIALQLAKPAGVPPRKIAEVLSTRLSANPRRFQGGHCRPRLPEHHC